MVMPDLKSIGGAIFNGMLYSTATFVGHAQDEAYSTAPGPNPLLYARAAVTSSAYCAASLPASCALLDSTNTVILLGTIPYVCLADILTLSPSLSTTVAKSCPLNLLQTGAKMLICLKSAIATTPVSTTCSKASTTSSSSKSSSTSSKLSSTSSKLSSTSSKLSSTSSKLSSSSSKSSSTSNKAELTSAASQTLGISSISTSPSSSSSSSISSSASLSSSSSAQLSSSTSTLRASNTVSSVLVVASEVVNATNYVVQAADPVPVTTVVTDTGAVISTNTSVAANTTTLLTNITTIAISTSSTILVIARDAASAYSAYSGLNGYGIPFQLLLVPQNGTTLPSLNDTALVGNFGGIVMLSEVSYDYGATGFQSALTALQWTELYTYQHTFGVRMVRMDVFPSTDSGTLAQGGCCAAGQEQYVSISDNSHFPTAGLTVGATMSTLGIYHYPATIVDSTIATAFAQFGPTTGYESTSTAGVINNINGRQQMVFFMSFATDWCPTSNFLQHAWIHWVTRGLYAGYRRINLGTQVDDMFLESSIYYPADSNFRIRTGDLDAIKSWIPTINAKLPTGSKYFMEIGHNGNGNIGQADVLDTTGKLCSGGAISYDDQGSTPLEFQKVLGSGTNIWPAKPTAYPYSAACTKGDPLGVWWATPENRDVFAHVSHTFTHEGENNATYSDIFNEISWNKAWLDQITLSKGTYFSSKGLIPPAITGLHNGDALSAWSKNGITNAVGDNTRSVLMNKVNEHWPLLTTVALNGFDGMQITPRWATNIYYNCDTTDCTVQEWINTSAGKGTITDLLELERLSSSRHLLGLHRDPYMFHQANLRQIDVNSTVVVGVSQKLSLIQMWVETVVAEMTRIVNWPIITLKHDDIGTAFADRMARDKCNPKMSYTLDILAQTITAVVVTTDSNTCSALIPVTVPGPVTDTQSFTTEQIGNDPLTIWVKMSGSAVKFTLKTPVAW